MLSEIQMIALLLIGPFLFPFAGTAKAQDRTPVVERVRQITDEMQRQADAAAIATAFRDCLHDSSVSGVISAEIQTQVFSNKAVAFINGYWAKPLNLSALYTHPDVFNALAKRLADNPSAMARLEEAREILEDAGQIVDPDVGAGLIFIPGNVAIEQGMSDLIDLAGSIASGAFLDDLFGWQQIGMHDFIFTLLIGVGGSLIAGLILDGCDGDEPDPYGPDGDADHDGIPNQYDADDDNDGTVDTEDRYPFDPSHSNTPCPPPGVCLSTLDLADAPLAQGLMTVVGKAFEDFSEAENLDSIEVEFGVGQIFSFPNP